jgi:hypothetical protein
MYVLYSKYQNYDIWPTLPISQYCMTFSHQYPCGEVQPYSVVVVFISQHLKSLSIHLGESLPPCMPLAVWLNKTVSCCNIVCFLGLSSFLFGFIGWVDHYDLSVVPACQFFKNPLVPHFWWSCVLLHCDSAISQYAQSFTLCSLG